MSTAGELREVNLVSSSQLKLRATAYLAERSEAAIFAACVLFNDAGRLERSKCARLDDGSSQPVQRSAKPYLQRWARHLRARADKVSTQ